MENKICPNCGQTLLYFNTVFDKDGNMVYRVSCCWCDYVSEKYNTKQEARENYENAILRL